MSLVCVLVLFRASVCAFRVSELLVVRLSFVVKLFRLCCVSCEIPRFSCRVSNSSFSFEFVVENFDSNFEFKFLEFSCRISNSSFSCRRSIRFLEFQFSCRRSIRFLEFRCSIRLLEFRCSIRLLEFRVLDSSTLNFEFVFSRRICRRNFRCLDLFNFSNFVALFDFSNFEFSIQAP